MSLTSTYPFESMQVGDSFVVSDRFQHARVAASEYARRNGQCYSCRVEYVDGQRYLRVHRTMNDQIPVDRRGSRGRRRIVQAVAEPSSADFSTWLITFAVGQQYIMPESYTHLYSAMIAWCELHSIKHSVYVSAQVVNNELVIKRIR